jgi:dTMP kinase
MMGGIFVIDGIDGAGKATQTRLLVERFEKEGVRSEHIDFPRYGHPLFGELLKECLAGKHGDFLHLDPKIAATLYALDRHEAAEDLFRWRSEGKIVIADRYASSNQIHQGGKVMDPGKRDLFLEWIEKMEHEVLAVPRPDAVIYLRVPVETSLELLAREREGKDPEAKEVLEKDRMYLERSFESAERLAATRDNWKTVECVEEGRMRSPEAIHEDVYALVRRLV